MSQYPFVIESGFFNVSSRRSIHSVMADHGFYYTNYAAIVPTSSPVARRGEPIDCSYSAFSFIGSPFTREITPQNLKLNRIITKYLLLHRHGC